MKTLNSRGKMVDAFVEEIIEGRGDHAGISNLHDASAEEIAQFKSKPCDHENATEALIYDEPSWLYDFRFCVVCGAGLGTV